MSNQHAKKVNPLTQRERKLLSLLKSGPQPLPEGIGPATVNKLISRKLILRTERLQDYGPEIYTLTDMGRLLVSDVTSKV